MNTNFISRVLAHKLQFDIIDRDRVDVVCRHHTRPFYSHDTGRINHKNSKKHNITKELAAIKITEERLDK